MKIKLFKREAISDGYYNNGMARYRRENNKELEVRVNEFMADKKVIDIKYQEATHGNYEDMDMIDKNVVSVQSLKDSVFVTYAD